MWICHYALGVVVMPREANRVCGDEEEEEEEEEEDADGVMLLLKQGCIDIVY